ncbi:MAG TPA: YegS/Rv2252/BmrU family lipid kinase [Nocardioides sp.]|nr:YegS/Rv2252/BmrU family lipid kinase [Nocardioides sp.]
MDPLLVITNADAGTADDEALRSALEILRKRASVDVQATSQPGELDGVLQRAGSRRIVVAGGDGSLHAVVSALHRRHELDDAVVGLLPMGTGNDFARTLGVPLDPEEAALVIVSGEPRPMDLIVDELGEIVVNNVHVGAGAQASRRGARWKERLGRVGFGKANLGRLGYPIGAALSAFQPPSVHMHVELDGRVVTDVDRPVLMVAIGNGANVGGGTELVPEADPEDGEVDVMISHAVGAAAKIGYALHLQRGEHHRRDDVQYLRGSQVTISGDAFWISADGEVSGPERQRSWHVEPSAYSFILPRAGL